MIQGVAQVTVMGQQKYAVRVKVNPDKAAERGIGINEVANALRSLDRLTTSQLDQRNVEIAAAA